MIRVYEANETQFNHNGLKVLNPLFAEIFKADNGDYYIELEDTLDNRAYYQKGMIYRVSSPFGEQGFRCDNPIIQNNRVSCKAWHLSYDSENYIVNNATATGKNCNDALNQYNDNTDIISPFTVSSDIISEPKTTVAVRKSLFAVFNDLLNVYGGHWVRDNYDFKINSTIGQDKGVVLAYNKNITDIKVEENWDSVCTKILPYVIDGDNEITLDEVYLETADIKYDIPYTKAVEFKYEEEEGKTAPTSTQEWKGWLRNEALKYLEANKIPQVNYSVSAEIQNVSDIGDRILIKHPKIPDIPLETFVISIKYDVIKERYTEIEFGNFKKEIKNITNEIASIVEEDVNIKTTENNALLRAELNEATAEINSVLSASYVINSGNEILVLDKLPKEEAVYCLKINSAGIGFSNTGINGTFNSAWTIDGTLNMQAINVINLTASLIKGGTLKLGGVNNASGTFELYDNSNRLIALMDREGLTVYAQNGDYVKLNAELGFAGFNKNGTKIYWVYQDEFHQKKSVVEEEITLCNKVRFIPITIYDGDNIVNDGIGLVSTIS